MKKIININTKSKKYPIIIESGSIIKNLKSEIKINFKTFIIIDNNLTYLLKKIKLNKNVFIINIEGSEKIKSIESYSKIMMRLLDYKIDRSSCLIAIGGGTVGDLSGFIASTILRGIKFILMPTTLLSQVDSSIGGKNGINTKHGKNLIGTFLQPDKVIIDIKVLKTLSKREIRTGYAEILKHALINDKKFYTWLDKNFKKIFSLKKKYLEEAIIKSIKIKNKYVSRDENEKLTNSLSRAMLNFGHTFGHALEAVNGYKKILTHGEAISIGFAIASKISLKLKKISNEEYREIINHIKKTGLPFQDKRVGTDKILQIIQNDKKNSKGKINLVLLKKIGSAYFKRGIEVNSIKKYLK